MYSRDLDIILSTPADWMKFKNKTVIVTGSTGRLGMYIVYALNECNVRWDLKIKILISARSEPKIHQIFQPILTSSNVEILLHDILEPVPYEQNVDYIFHTAGLASPSDFTHNPVGTLWGHLQGTKNVLELAKKTLGCTVLYVSTVETYGAFRNQDSVCETDMGIIECNTARACYPEAKRMCETMLASYEQQYGINYKIVKLSHTLGPGISLNDGRAFAEFIKCGLENHDIILHSDGSQIRTYTYVSDAIGAMFLVLTKGNEYIYNIANLENKITTLELAKVIASLSPHPINVKVQVQNKSDLLYLPFKLPLLDSTKISQLGWKPQINTETLFKWIIESFE